jgi:hypothetical protein
VVGTNQNLVFSNVFAFFVIGEMPATRGNVQGTTAEMAYSHWFNITDGPNYHHPVQPFQTDTPTRSSVSSRTTTLTTPPTTTPMTASDGGFGTGAKLGLAVGVVALILGFAGAWWWSRRNRTGRGHQSAGAVRTEKALPPTPVATK